MELLQDISCANDAFLIGYLAGDGCFRQDKRKLVNGGYSLHKRLYISDTCDLDILEWIVTHYPNTGIKTRKRVINNIERTLHTLYFPKAFMISLSNFGLFHKKPNRIYENIPDSFFIHYLQGLSLADGCVHIRNRLDCTTPRLNFCIAHTSENLFSVLQNILHTKYNYPIKLNRRTKENVIYLDCQHTKHNIKFLKTLYIDNICPVNHAKVKKVKAYLNTYAS